MVVIRATPVLDEKPDKGGGGGGEGLRLLFRGVDVIQETSIYPRRVHGAPLGLRLLLQVILQDGLLAICKTRNHNRSDRWKTPSGRLEAQRNSECCISNRGSTGAGRSQVTHVGCHVKKKNK